MAEKQEMEEPAWGKLGHTCNASLAFMRDRVRAEERKLVKRKSAVGVQESGTWRQELGLMSGGEGFRERVSSSHKDVDVQTGRRVCTHFLHYLGTERRRSQSSSILL